MKILYATMNKSKIFNMKRRLKDEDIEIVTPNDMGISINVNEDGKKPVDNAVLKAQAYYDKTQMITMAADSGFYINGLEEARQPGVYVRRVNDKTLSDDEMIDYYRSVAEELGGEAEAHYVTGVALIVKGKLFTIEVEEEKMILTSKVYTGHKHKGNPLDVITIDPVKNKYCIENVYEDYQEGISIFDIKVKKFLKEHLNM